MSQVVTLHDTVTYSKNQLVDAPLAELLQHRYFNTDDTRDTFEAREVVLDFDDPDLEAGAMVSRGYKNGNTVTFRSSLCEPPRVAPEDQVDVQGKDRLLFEQLCYPQGENSPTRSDAFQALLRIKSQRLVARVNRQIEKLCANVLLENSIIGSIPTSPTDNTPVDIEIRYYDKDTGNPQRFAPHAAWGETGATPYDDVCAMVNELTARGTMPDDLLISAEAFSLLSQDPKFLAEMKTLQHNKADIIPGEIDKARFICQMSFGGWLLNIIVYTGAYKNAAGQISHYLPKGFVCVIKSGCGRTLCGGCTLVNAQNLGDDLGGSFVAKRGKYCLSKYVDVNNQTVAIRCESRPLPAPHASWQWITMDAGNGNAISQGAQGVVCNLTFESNAPGASGLPDDGNYKKGQVINSRSVAPTGYEFDHWEFNGEVLEDSTATEVICPSESGIVTAVFSSRITFEKGSNGGIQYPQLIPYGETDTLNPVTLTSAVSGKTFQGWATSSAGAVVYGDQDPITPAGETTLYPVFG